MTNIETVVVQEIQVEAVEQQFELSLAELDMVGGGSMSIIA